MNKTILLLAAALGATLGLNTARGQAFVRNPSFESNYNDTWPHYSAVDEWAGASGVNDATGPFHNTNTPVPDRERIGFKQGGGDVTQDISGLTPGTTYWLQFFYDGRVGGGASESMVVLWNDQEIGRVADLRPSTGPYYFMSAPFVPDADFGTIRFTHIVAGDRTLLLDGVSIVARSTNDVVLRNPSFEASGTLPATGVLPAIAGWGQTGAAGVDDGSAGLADNGTIPDQALVGFIEGPGSLSQAVERLIVGNEYEIRLAVNARSGTAPRLQVKMGDAVLKEQAVSAGSYQVVSAKFTATASDTSLTLAQTKDGADVLLIDDVRLLGTVKKELPPMVFSPLAGEVAPGQTVEYSLTVPAEAITEGGVDIRLASSNPNVARLVGAAADGSLTLHFGTPAGGATSPVSGMKLWLKADGVSGVADAAKLASWPDDSGLNRPATNPNAANQPVWIANGRAGKPVVRFDDLDEDFTPGAVQWLDTAADIQTKNGQSYSAFVVFQSNDSGTSAGALEGRDNILQPLDLNASGNLGRTVLFIDTRTEGRTISSVSAQASLNSPSVYTPGTWLQAGIVQDAAAATLTMFLDGGLAATTAMGAEGGMNAGWRLGATKQGHGGLKGDIAELIVYDRALTEAERKQVEAYLRTKWALPARTTETFAVETLSRGRAAINVLDAAKIPFGSTPSVNVVASFVRNASFESNPAAPFPGYGTILGWTGTGQTGLNRTDAPTNPAGPFGDNGLVPDREQVGFIQGNGSLSQEISGLTPGRRYWLQFHYNARNCCGERTQKLTVRFAGNVLAEYPDLKPVADLGEVNYYHAHLPFTAEAASGLLEFVTQATGDASTVIDGVTIVARAADEIPIKNPSFEASGSPPGVGYLQPYAIAGWEGSAGGRGVNVDGEGPFTDNGDVPDQDRAALLQNVGFLSQMITGLTAGQTYTVVVALNARNCCGGTLPIARVSVNDVPLTEELITPIGGRNPYHVRYLPFAADSTEAVLRIDLAATEPAGGDATLLLDDVHLVPGTRTPPEITSQPVGVSVNGGETITLEVGATGQNLAYEWRRNGVALKDGGRISGAASTKLTITGATAADAGNYLAAVTDGLGVIGSEVALVEVAVTVQPKLMVSLAGGMLTITSDPQPLPEGFVLQVAPAVTGPWTDQAGANTPVTIPVGNDTAQFLRAIRP